MIKLTNVLWFKWFGGLVSCSVLLLFTVEPLLSQENEGVEKWTERAFEKMELAEERAAIELFEKVLEEDPLHYDALWNLAILYSKEGFRMEDESEMMRYYEKGKELAERSREHYPDRADSHYAYAVAIGRIADISSPRDRIRASEEIREAAKKVLELNPEHDRGWHLLGVWHTRAANLSRAERWAANLLFGGAPEGASNSEAERCLKKAIELSPDTILFHLDLAVLYKEIGRDEDAADVLNRVVEMEPKDKDDPGYLEDARRMLSDLQ